MLPEPVISCPHCGHVNEYDPDNDVVLCEQCGELIFIEDEEADNA